MNVKVEALPESQSRVTVEVEPERTAAAREDAFRRIAREVVIPGFRKGKAPRALVERYVNPGTIQSQTESILVDSVWDELSTGQFKDVGFYDRPQIQVTQHNPVVFEIIFTMPPSCTLGDYKSIRLAPDLVTVTDDDVNKALDRIRDEQAQWQPVEHRPVRQGDMLTIQAHGTIGQEPITVPQGYTVAVDEKTSFLVPGFAMRLIDMEIGTEKEFAIEVPEGTPNTEAGATGTAFITVQEIKEKIVPALDDALAKTLGHEDVASLTNSLGSSLLATREEEARNRMTSRILDAVAGISTVAFPRIMVDQQVESMITERGESLRRQGLDMDFYLRILNMTVDQLRADLRPQAEGRIRNFLLLDALRRAEGIVVEESAVEAEIERMVAGQADAAAARRELSTNEMHDRIQNNLLVKQSFDRLIAIVTEGMSPVAQGAETAMPSITDSIVGGEQPAAENKEEKPKLIIATH